MRFGGFKVHLVHAHAVYEGLDFLDGGGSDLGLELRQRNISPRCRFAAMR